MAAGLLDRAYGTWIVLRNLPGQSRVPYLPRARLEELRDTRVRDIVSYAARTVPFYQEWFRDTGTKTSDLRTADDLDRLPLVDRHMYRAHAERFRSTSALGRTAMPLTSGGATGEPITVYRDRNSALAKAAFTQRERDVVRKLLGGVRAPRELTIAMHGSSTMKVTNLRRNQTFASALQRNRRVLSLLTPIDEVIAEINEFRPHSFGAYGSYVEALFRMVDQRRIPMHLPKLVIYGADGIHPDGIRLIREQYGVGVFAKYGAIEAVPIGFLCEECQGYHLNMDLVHLKLIDAHGRRVEPGEPGEVVVSSLTNRGTVLLNYRLGDIGVMSDESCPCGRTLPLLSQLSGRVQDILHLPGGGFLHAGAVNRVFYMGRQRDGGKVLQFQLIQRAIADFELRLAAVDRAAYNDVVQDYVADLEQLIGAWANIEPVYYEGRVPTGASGKLRPVVSLLGDGKAAAQRQGHGDNGKR